MQWIAEDRLNEFRSNVEAVLNDPSTTADLFLASLAALEMLDGVKPEEFDKTPPGKYVLPIVNDGKGPPSVRALALRLVPPTEPELKPGVLAELARSADAGLRREAVRTLSSPLEP